MDIWSCHRESVFVKIELSFRNKKLGNGLSNDSRDIRKIQLIN